MILATCPCCSEPVRFPESDLPPDAHAKCPWCLELFNARDVSAQLPPPVELFDGAGLPLTPIRFNAPSTPSITGLDLRIDLTWITLDPGAPNLIGTIGGTAQTFVGL